MRQRKIPITLTFPEEFIRDLHAYVPRRQLSQFIYKAVYDDLELKKKQMAKAFIEAAKDEELNAEFEIWDNCIGDGLDETNEYKAR